jgi:hypothetical protein
VGGVGGGSIGGTGAGSVIVVAVEVSAAKLSDDIWCLIVALSSATETRGYSVQCVMSRPGNFGNSWKASPRFCDSPAKLIDI